MATARQRYIQNERERQSIERLARQMGVGFTERSSRAEADLRRAEMEDTRRRGGKMAKKTAKSKVRYVECPPGPGLYRFLEEDPRGQKIAKKIGYRGKRR